MARTLLQRHDGTRLRSVALVGIDGSGKTSQGHRLADALTGRGVPATYWQNAGGRRWFGRLARRLGRRDAQRLLGRNAMLFAESVLRWLAIARALVRSRLRGRIAVMDRYAVCQYASIRAHGGGSRWERLARVLYRLFPPPDVTFLLAVEPGEAYRRIEARGTDHEDIGYLRAAAAAYRSLPEFAGFVIIDANRTPDEVTRAIRERLAGWLPAGTLPVGESAGPGPDAGAEPDGRSGTAAAPRVDGAAAPRVDGATAPRVDGATAPRVDGATAPRVDGAAATGIATGDGAPTRAVSGWRTGPGG